MVVQAEKHRPAAPGVWFLGACLLAVVVVVAAYSNHFRNGFHFDDSHVIVDNLSIRSLTNIYAFFTDPEALTTRPQNATYRPILGVSFAFDFWRGEGLDPIAFHQSQFGFLLLFGVVLWAFFFRLCEDQENYRNNRFVALLATALFCAHTANSETVNYLSARSSLLASLGVGTSLLIYLVRPNWRRFQIHLIPMLLGALVKPIAVMYAPLLFAYLLICRPKEAGGDASDTGDGFFGNFWRALRGSFPAFVTGAAMAIFVRSMDSDALVYSNVDWLDYARTQPFVWLHYFRLFLLPVGLTADSDWTLVTTWYDTRLFAGMLFIAALGFAIVWMARRKGFEPAAFGLAWFAIALLPTSSVVPLSEVYNEHRIFLPFVGLALTFSWLTIRAPWWNASAHPKMRAMLIIASVLFFLANAVGTHYRNEVWRSNETLWADVVSKSPKNGRGLMNYGLTRMRRGDYDGALALFERAHRILPDYSTLETNLAIVHSALGREDEAKRHFERALLLRPNEAQSHLYYARWLAESGQGQAAIRQLERTLEISPRLGIARQLLARIYAASGNREGLLRVVNGTLSTTTDDPEALAFASGQIYYPGIAGNVEAYEKLGLAKVAAGNWLDAAIVYGHVLTLSPGNALAWNNLGWARHELGFNLSAVECFHRALEFDPQLEIAGNNIQWVESQASGS